MVRRYEEPIEVRAARQAESAAGEGAAPGAPDAFVWRGRLYVVREVLDHWQERRPWWRDALDGSEPAGQGGQGRPTAQGAPGRPGRPTAQGAPGAPGRSVGDSGGVPSAMGARGAAAPPAVLDGARESQVWRVEASAGRTAGTGVYDLGTDPSLQQWRLLRVAD